MARRKKKSILPKIRIGRISRKVGLPPGTLYYVGDDVVESGEATLLRYNQEGFEEIVWPAEKQIEQPPRDATNWYHVNGLHDTELVEKIGSQFGLHPLLLEDIINVEHLPKLEEFDNSLLIITKGFVSGPEGGSERMIHLAVVIGDGFILSFQERGPDIFTPVKERIKQSKGKIRERDAGYLMYSLIDMAVDTFYGAVEKYGEDIENFEEEIDNGAGDTILKNLMTNKRGLLSVRKTIFPVRETVNQLLNGGNPLIGKQTASHLRDVKDHCNQITETTGFYIELNNSLKERYISGISLAMNRTMQVLTVAATIFIPLTFIVGVYGMNFDFMPELHWKYSYFVLWGIMIVIGILLVWYFRKKKLF